MTNRNPHRLGRSTRRTMRWLAHTGKQGFVGCLIATMLMVTTPGCGVLDRLPGSDRLFPGPHATHASYHDSYGLNIEYPQVAECATAVSSAAEQATAPHALEDPSQLPAMDLTLEQAIGLAVQQSPVLRSIGGTVVSAPAGTQTIFNPALVAASPQQGTEAALAAFDAQYTQSLTFGSTDLPSNRIPFQLPGSPLVSAQVSQNRNANFVGELSKQTATGARFALRHTVSYLRTQDASRTQLLFPSSFSGWVEAEWRQPLLQGSGVLYNRIAGPVPNGNVFRTPGQYNGVLIARINEDVALADFENGLIQLVADVEQTYWNLATAYRVLDATVKGREAAQQTFQFQEVRLEVGSGRSDEEAQARSQFYQFQAQVESALGGEVGLYATEQSLRYLIGLPATDGRLIRPVTRPTDVRVVFDWQSALAQAIDRRVEVRKQKFNLKRRELELVAARLNYRPRLDFLAQYRWNGLGNDLIGHDNDPALDNFYGTITGGRYQQGLAGVELTFPVGFRMAGVALAEAKLNLRRERALLAETELRISHDLSAAARQVDLTYQLVETNFNRYQADQNQVEVLRRRYRDGNDNINFLLQAQRQVVNSETEFYRSVFNYNLAIRDLHQQKGSLLAYNQVQLAEGPWANGASADAHRVGRFLSPHRNPAEVSVPPTLTTGSFDPAAIQATGFGDPLQFMTESDGVVHEGQSLPPESDSLTDEEDLDEKAEEEALDKELLEEPDAESDTDPEKQPNPQEKLDLEDVLEDAKDSDFAGSLPAPEGRK